MMELYFDHSRHFYIFSLGHHSLPLVTREVCFIMELCVDIIPYMCHTTANWLTLGLSGGGSKYQPFIYTRPYLFNPAQRFIYICKPYLTKHWCTVKKTVMGVSVAMLLSIAHVVTRTVDRTYTVWTSGERNYSLGDNKMCLY